MSTIKQCVIGNEGSIGLLVYNDGSVYFIGFARRGEDGENGMINFRVTKSTSNWWEMEI